jgi:hypothetical protein
VQGQEQGQGQEQEQGHREGEITTLTFSICHSSFKTLAV